MSVLSDEHRALMSELEHLISEERNPNTMEIDLLPTVEVLRVINREDRLRPGRSRKSDRGNCSRR